MNGYPRPYEATSTPRESGEHKYGHADRPWVSVCLSSWEYESATMASCNGETVGPYEGSDIKSENIDPKFSALGGRDDRE